MILLKYNVYWFPVVWRKMGGRC